MLFNASYFVKSEKLIFWMIVKIITCHSKINKLIKMNNLLMHVNSVFGSCCQKVPKYFATECKGCPLNAYLFARNYFSAVNCSCKNTIKKHIVFTAEICKIT